MNHEIQKTPKASEAVQCQEFAAGDVTAKNIKTALGDRLYFPDHNGDIERLVDMLNTLSAVTVSPEELADDIDVVYWKVYGQAENTRMHNHRANLAGGKVLRWDDEESPEWQIVPLSSQPIFSEVLNRIAEEIESSEVDADDQHHISDEIVTQAQSEVLNMLNDKVSALRQSIPEPEPRPDDEHRARTSRIARFLLKKPEIVPVYEPYPENALIDTRKISRKARKLTAFLEAFIENPSKEIALALVNSHQEDIESLALRDIDRRIATANSELLPEILSTSRRRTTDHKTHKYDRSEKSAKPKKDLSSTDSAREISNTNEAEIEDVGCHDLYLPWLNDSPTKKAVRKLTYQGGEVYITEGIPPKMLGISELVRQKTSARNQDLGLYDSIIEQLARRIACGIMPYENSNSVIAVRHRSESSFFKDIPMWYSSIKSPNAPRVYFTLKKMGELLGSNASRGNLNRNLHCLIVLAETDKANQIKVLSELTGRSRSSLRAGGAGSE